jgi:prepilin-type N-terminal cleavage/methylation domain-containing protein
MSFFFLAIKNLALQNCLVKSLHRAEAGFSLLEMSLVLAIMGVIIGLSLPPLLQMQHVTKVKMTEQHQEAVMIALAGYALRTGYLPCPSDPRTPGEARSSCHTHMAQAIGGIPYLTLGIPEKYAQDGFYQPLIYAVVPALTNPYHNDRIVAENRLENDQELGITTAEGNEWSHATGFCSRHMAGDPLIVRNPYGQPVQGHSKHDFLAVVLLSRGEQGINEPPSETERINLDPHLTFVDYPYSTNSIALHRHRLKWASRDFLISYYGRFSCAALRIQSAQQKRFQDHLIDNIDNHQDIEIAPPLGRLQE